MRKETMLANQNEANIIMDMVLKQIGKIASLIVIIAIGIVVIKNLVAEETDMTTIIRDALQPIGEFATYEFKIANLKPYMINGKTALVRKDIDLNLVDELGRTNLKRMELGLSPLDVNGASYELHHIGQEADATLAILTQAEHDNAVLHGFKMSSEIDRKIFAKQRRRFWKSMANIFEAGGIE